MNSSAVTTPAGTTESTASSRNPAWFQRSRLVLGLLLLAGVIVYLPALRTRYLLDDYLHASMIHGNFPGDHSPFNLYDFVNGDNRAELVARGLIPWWSDPGLKIRFFRPLSSVMVWGEHHLLGDAPLPLHLHSLLWWCAVVLAARALFQRLFAPRPALIATVIFAVAPCHSLPIGWLANREALVSLTLALGAVRALICFREEGRARHLALAAALFALALLAGEYALGMLAYVAAIEIVSRGVSPARRAASILGFSVPALSYLGVRAKLGYGTAGSGFYTDPFRETPAFLAWAPRRFALQIGNAWFSLDGITLTVATPWWVLTLILAGAALLVGFAVRRAFARLDEGTRRSASWLLLGSTLALVPVLAVVPSPRVLGASMVGIAAVVALVLDDVWFRRGAEGRSRASELYGHVALALGFAHLVHAPVTAWLLARHHQRQADDFLAAAREITDKVGDPPRADVFVLRGMEGSFFLPFALSPSFRPPPRWHMLAHTGHTLAIRRGPRTLDLIVPDDHSVYPVGSGNLFRSERVPLGAGDVFTFPGVSISLLENGKRGPRSARVELEDDIDQVAWITEDITSFHNVDPPGLGFGKAYDP